MKIRTDFVPNSSSTNFILMYKKDLSKDLFFEVMGLKKESLLIPLYEKIFEELQWYFTNPPDHDSDEDEINFNTEDEDVLLKTFNEERLFLLQSELDAMYFNLYGFNIDDVPYIMETFPIIRKGDLEKFGTYRTKDTILDFLKEMNTAEQAGRNYLTSIDPPPSDIKITHDYDMLIS